MRELSRTVAAVVLGALVGGLVVAVATPPVGARTGHLTPEQVIQDDATLTIAAPVVLVTDAGREVALYLEDNRFSGSLLVAASRDPGQPHWTPAQHLTRKGVVSFSAVTLPGGRVTVAYRFHRASSSLVTTLTRTLGPHGVWGRPVRLARERIPSHAGVTPGLAFDVDRHGVVAAWPTRHGVRSVVRRSDGSARERVLFPHLASVELAHVTSDGGVDVVGTRTGASGPSGVVMHQTSGAGWTRACFVNCSTRRPSLAITSASMNDQGELAVAWTHPSRKAFADNDRSLVRFRDDARRWTAPTVLARQATSGPQVTIDEHGVAAVTWQARPPHREALSLRFHRPDGQWVGGHTLSSRRPSFAGDPEPLAVTDSGRDTLIVYKQARRFAEIDQMRAVVRRCPVRGPCSPWRWVPTTSTDVGAAALPRGATTLVWADGCAVVFENCFFKRVASRRLLPQR